LVIAHWARQSACGHDGDFHGGQGCRRRGGGGAGAAGADSVCSAFLRPYLASYSPRAWMTVLNDGL